MSEPALRRQALGMTTAATTSQPADQPADRPQPAQQPPPPVRPLLRSGTDRMVGGVCGGLAEYTGIDATLWRVGAVFFTLTGGAGLLIYLLLWIVVPAAPLAEGTGPSALERGVQRLRAAFLDRRGPSAG
jgi:phage shock protein C